MARGLPVHLLDRVLNTPLLVTRDKAATIHEVLSSPEHLASAAALAAAQQRSTQQEPAQSTGSVALIDISGTLVSRSAGGMEALSGLRSYESIRQDLDRAVEDQGVECIVLRVDSPGGEAAGAFDLADHIRASTDRKRIVSIAADQACSAAYLLAASAEKLYTTQTGVLGSIGVVLLHCDRLARDVQSGLRYTEVTSGARKADGNPHAPLQGAAYAAIQAEVDQLADLFFSKVSAFRGLSADAIRDLQAGVLLGQAAVAAHLADDVTTLEALIGASAQEAFMPNEKKSAAVAEAQAPAPAAVAPVATATPVEVDVEKLVSEATAKAREDGIQAERARVAHLERVTIPGHEKLLAQAKAEGWDAFRLLESQALSEKAMRETSLAQLAQAGQAIASKAPFTATPDKPGANLPEALDRESSDDQIRSAWETVPAVQKEFTTLAAFAACVKAEGYALTKEA